MDSGTRSPGIAIPGTPGTRGHGTPGTMDSGTRSPGIAIPGTPVPSPPPPRTRQPPSRPSVPTTKLPAPGPLPVAGANMVNRLALHHYTQSKAEVFAGRTTTAGSCASFFPGDWEVLARVVLSPVGTFAISHAAQARGTPDVRQRAPAGRMTAAIAPPGLRINERTVHELAPRG